MKLHIHLTVSNDENLLVCLVYTRKIAEVHSVSIDIRINPGGEKKNKIKKGGKKKNLLINQFLAHLISKILYIKISPQSLDNGEWGTVDATCEKQSYTDFEF